MALDKSILDLNFQDISRFPILNRTEESELARKARSGDKAAKDKLLASNLLYDIKVARDVAKNWKGVDLEDMISEGSLGLLNAIDKFDSSKGFRLITYADKCIRRSITRNCFENNLDELATLSLNDLIQGKDSEEETELIEFNKDTRYDPVATTERKFLKRDLDQVLKTLNSKEEIVLTFHYGLHGHKKMTLEQIGTRFKLSKERIRQIENSALNRIRHSRKLDGYVG